MFGEKEVLEEINEQAKEMLDTTKAILRGMDDEWFELQASSWKRMYDATINKGFKHEDAMQLVIASMKK